MTIVWARLGRQPCSHMVIGLQAHIRYTPNVARLVATGSHSRGRSPPHSLVVPADPAAPPPALPLLAGTAAPRPALRLPGRRCRRFPAHRRRRLYQMHQSSLAGDILCFSRKFRGRPDPARPLGEAFAVDSCVGCNVCRRAPTTRASGAIPGPSWRLPTPARARRADQARPGHRADRATQADRRIRGRRRRPSDDGRSSLRASSR